MTESIETTVTRLGGLGDGMAQLPDGRALILPKTLPGDRVRVRLTGSAGGQAYGEVLELLSPGPSRVAPLCGHYESCGGCSLQHLAQAEYRAFKHQRIADAVRQAGYEHMAEIPVHFLPHATRRRADFKLMEQEGHLRLSYAGKRSHRLFAVENCPILAPALQEALPQIEGILQPLTAEKTRPHSLQLTLTDSGIDAVAESEKPLSPQTIARLVKLTDLSTIQRISLHTPSGMRILRETTRPTLRLGERDLHLPPGAFLQASAEGQHLLTQAVLRATAEAETIADLFCGIGTYGLPLAQAGKKITAADSEKTMIAALQAAAQNLPLTAAARNLFTRPLTPPELNAFDAVVINPPRAGAREQAECLSQSRVPCIVMVSCNPATFARDARILREGGYGLAHAEGIDQFTFSAHVEMVGNFVR